MGNLGGWEIVIILAVLVLLFGAKKLPDMARSVGQSARVFKGEMKGLRDDDKPAAEQPRTEPAPLPPAQAQTATQAPTPAPPAAEPPASNPNPPQGSSAQ